MPNCPKCGAEVDVGQKMCAWCGVELAGAGSPAPAPPPSPAPVAPQSATPFPTPPRSRTPFPTHGPTVEDARNLAKAGDYDGALTVFRAVVESNPNDQEALFGIGGVYFKKGDHRRASEAWLQLKTLNPNYPNIDGWLSQLQTRPPSSQQIQAPPPPSFPTPSPARPSGTPSRSFRREDLGGTVEEDDWRRQAVRVERTEVPRAPKPEPKPAPVPDTEAPQDISKWMGGKVAGWVVPVGWVLIALYLLVVYALYL
ncbi:MAG: tetratricopeptide repeat protein [Candidatus Omnitrophica bacterium]|nr:hypothetical protein [bacterium]NUN97367.1 tetratricopeptide repeat protein [Candidatus Omnitrophota bacterium]